MAEQPIGPLFISGRQHSGNSVTTCVFEQVPDCFAARREGWFFEQRGLVEKIEDPARRARRVVELLRLEDDQLARRTTERLEEWHRRHPGASAVEVYRAAMELILSDTGKRFWVRRATSYIFYAAEIFDLMPDARMLYLLRNPYDVCASLKRRRPKLDRFVGWVISWNRGLRSALRLRETHPDRFLIVRYEDLVARPAETMRGVFAFAGVPFEERYLDVPHVNPSEAPGQRTSEVRGLNPSRIYYYRGILAPAEVAAVDTLVWTEKLLEHYPDLPHRGQRHPISARIGALGLLAMAPYRFAAHQVGLLGRHSPRWRLSRILRRARIAAR